jgi:hypothetical protein
VRSGSRLQSGSSRQRCPALPAQPGPVAAAVSASLLPAALPHSTTHSPVRPLHLPAPPDAGSSLWAPSPAPCSPSPSSTCSLSPGERVGQHMQDQRWPPCCAPAGRPPGLPAAAAQLGQPSIARPSLCLCLPLLLQGGACQCARGGVYCPRENEDRCRCLSWRMGDGQAARAARRMRTSERCQLPLEAPPRLQCMQQPTPKHLPLLPIAPPNSRPATASVGSRGGIPSGFSLAQHHNHTPGVPVE